jgi:hypothetical protein
MGKGDGKRQTPSEWGEATNNNDQGAMSCEPPAEAGGHGLP